MLCSISAINMRPKAWAGTPGVQSAPLYSM